jgi:uncharacterized protein YciI
VADHASEAVEALDARLTRLTHWRSAARGGTRPPEIHPHRTVEGTMQGLRSRRSGRLRTVRAALLVAAAACGGATAQRPREEARPAAPAASAVRPGRPLVFAAFYERGPAWDPTKAVVAQPTIREHVAQHEALGTRLIAAAPFAPRAGDPAVGMVVFVAASAADAQRWLDQDPAVLGGVMRAILRRWGVSAVRGVGEAGQ